MAAACEDKFKFLKVGAVTDAKHDFQGDLNFNPDRALKDSISFGHILEGLDKSSCKDEPSKFREVSEDNLLESILPQTLDAIKADPGSITTKVGINGSVNYEVKVLVTDDIKKNTYPVDEMIDFLGSEDLNIVYDAASIGIPDFLNTMKPPSDASAKLNVNYLVNREVINDPADKVIEPPKSKNKALEYTVLIDREPSDIIYSKNTPDLKSDDLQRSNFFSIYDFKLGPVGMKQNQRPGKKSMSLEVSVEIQEDGGKRLFFTNDPKKENSIAEVVRRINRLFSSKESAFHRKIAAYLQSKRSGDWFQALSCLDLQRLYGNPLTGELKTVAKFITLITHDRVLLAYALFLGVNVLFTQAEKHTLIYFQNRTTIADVGAILKAQKDKATAYLAKQAATDITWMETLIGWVSTLKGEYTETITKIVNELVSKKTYLSTDYYKALTRFMCMDTFQEYEGDEGYIATLDSMKSKGDLDELEVKTVLSIMNNVAAHRKEYTDEKSIRQHIESLTRNYPIESPTVVIEGGRGARSAAAIEAKELAKKMLASMVNNFKSRLPMNIYVKFIELHMRWAINAGTAKNGGVFVYELLKSDAAVFTSALAELATSDAQGGGGCGRGDCSAPNPGIIAQISNMVWSYASHAAYLVGFRAEEPVPVADARVRRQEIIPNLNTGNEIEAYTGFLIHTLTDAKPEPITVEQVLKALQRGGGISREVTELGEVVYSLLNNVYLSKVIYFLENIDSIDNWDFEYLELFAHILREFLKEDESAAQRTHLFYTLLPEMDYSKVDHSRASGLELVSRHFMLRSQDKLFGDAPNFSGSEYPVEEVIDRALKSVAAAEERPFEERRDALLRYLRTQLEEVVIETEATEPVEEAEPLEAKKPFLTSVAENNPMAPKKRRSRRRRSKGRSATRKITFNNEPTAQVF